MPKTLTARPRLGERNVLLEGDIRATQSVNVIVDFGHASGGEDSITTAIATAPWVLAGMTLLCTPATTGTVDHPPLDAVVEGIQAVVTGINPGVGFDLAVRAPAGSWGRYAITVTG